jgi:hypothetical protein
MILHKNPDGTGWIGIHEVYYNSQKNKKDKLQAYAENAEISTFIETKINDATIREAKRSLLWQLEKMEDAVQEDLLTVKDFSKKG